jgi:hypothetical protein
MPPEDRVMWLQSLSWSLKYQKGGFTELLTWREEFFKSLDEFCAGFKGKKGFLQRLEQRKTMNSYSLVASNLRTRLSLCSPQYSPTMVKTAYVTCLADALDACQRIFQVHKKKAGVLGKIKNNKCEMHDILKAQSESLKSIVVYDQLLETHHQSARYHRPSRTPEIFPLHLDDDAPPDIPFPRPSTY